jgi:hypothetical protein
MKRFAPVDITLPWKAADGPPVTRRLIFTGPRGGHVWRTSLNEEVWKRALASAGVIPERKPGESYAESRENGMHALRHFYASVLLDAGENIKALAEYLGHSDPGLTLSRVCPPHAIQPGTNPKGRQRRFRRSSSVGFNTRCHQTICQNRFGRSDSCNLIRVQGFGSPSTIPRSHLRLRKRCRLTFGDPESCPRDSSEMTSQHSSGMISQRQTGSIRNGSHTDPL